MPCGTFQDVSISLTILPLLAFLPPIPQITSQLWMDSLIRYFKNIFVLLTENFILSWNLRFFHSHMSFFFLYTDYWHGSPHCLHSGDCGPVQQPNPPGLGGLHCGICGSCHWTVNGLQFWLRCQSCQRSRTTSFLCYRWLGNCSFHVINKFLASFWPVFGGIETPCEI